MNRKIMIVNAVLIFLLFMCISSVSFAKDYNTKTGQSFLAKTSDLGNPSRTLANINNWSYWIYSDAHSGIDPEGNSGGVYPRGTAGAIFRDGLVWGAKIDDQIRVGGNTYSIGTQAVSEQIYKIRSDWKTLSLNSVREDAAEVWQTTVLAVTEAQMNDVIEQYILDWQNWPVDEGAPYVDVNDNGIYDPVLDADGNPDAFAGDYPGIANADQVVFSVANDLDNGKAVALYGSNSMGIELKTTIWGYNQRSAILGQLLFKKFEITNVGTDTFDEMYVAQWCDPDLGNFSDDLVGCDSAIGLGFAYNGGPTDNAFEEFGLPPSAVGYDFFQGPLVTGVDGQDLNNNGIDDDEDTGTFNLANTPVGTINLPMTTFAYFSAGNAEWSDPSLGDYDGTLEWYNLLRGNIANTDVINPTPFTHRLDAQGAGPATNFPLNGDPLLPYDARTNDIDGVGNNFAAADRRMALCSGPFTMAPGETQEIVVAIIGGAGSDYLNSVTQIKNNDVVAQSLFNDFFQTIPKAPPSPEVSVTKFEDQIVLNWGEDNEGIARTEDTYFADSDSTGYTFEGYNIYQISSGLGAEALKIATFDRINGVTTIEQEVFLEEYGVTKILPVQNGTDNGVQRFFVVDKDYFTNTALRPGNNYTFAVTAYNHNPQPSLITDLSLESSIVGIPVQTGTVTPGLAITVAAGDGVEIEQIAGGSDGQVAVFVVDPLKVTGDDYEVFFTEDTDTNSATFGSIFWNVRNASTSTVLVQNQLQTGDIADGNDQPLFDGLQAKVAGPALDFKDFQMTANGAGPIVPPEGAAADFQGFPSLRPTDGQQVGTGHWFFHTGDNGTRGSYEAFLSRSMRNDNFDRAVPYDWEMRFTSGGSWALRWFEDDFLVRLPFELWNAGINTPDDPSDDYRLIPYFLSSGGVGAAQTDPLGLTYQLDPNDHSGSGADNDPYTPWIYWIIPHEHDDGSAGTAGYDTYLTQIDTTIVGANGNVAFNGGTEVIARSVLVNWNGDDVLDGSVDPSTQQFPEEGSVIRLVTTKPNTLADEFGFTAPSVEQSVALEKAEAKKITVFPNPYYAGNSQEANRFDRFVTFYHLPQVADIRIFNLAGDQVRRLEKDDPSQFLKWDLRNSSDLPVASGIYFANCKMTLSDGSKVTKTLKVFVIQRRQQIKFF